MTGSFVLVHHQGFEQLSKSESIEKWRFDTLPDSSVSTSVSILVDAAVGGLHGGKEEKLGYPRAF